MSDNNQQNPTQDVSAAVDPVDGGLLGRRTMMTGLATVGLAALLAACGEDRETGLAKIGASPTTTALSDGHVTDEVLIRTATALEYNIIDAYERMLGAGHFTDSSVIEVIIANHRSHAAATARLTDTPVTSKSARIDSLYIAPALALVAESKDKNADALALAHALESLAASTYQTYVAHLADPDLRGEAVRLGADEAAHAAVLALQLQPGLAGVIPELSTDGEGVDAVAAVPTAFGSLAGVDVTLGAVSETGSREALTFETPSLNTLEYLD